MTVGAPAFYLLDREWRREDDFSAKAANWMLRGRSDASDFVFEASPESFSPALPDLSKLGANEAAVEAAAPLSLAIDVNGIAPSRVVRTSAGGIAFYFFGDELLSDGSHRKYACLEADECGELTALYKTRDTETEVFSIPDEIALDAAVVKVREFLKG